MAKGKKKGGKKTQEPDSSETLASLSLEDTGASTSQTSAPVTETSIHAPASVATAVVAPAVLAPAVVAPAPAETSVVVEAAKESAAAAEETKQEEGGLGLAVMKRKRPPRKKKGPVPQDEGQEKPGVCASTPQPSTGPPQQWQRPTGPPQQWQQPTGPPQQPGGPPQQWQRPTGPPQQPGGPPQQWQRPTGPPQQWQQPTGPPQQPGGPPQLWQQPTGRPQQRGDPPQQCQRPTGPPQQWQQPTGPSQQPGGPLQQWQQPTRPPQQPGGPPQHWQQPTGPPQQPGGPPQQWRQLTGPQQQPGGPPQQWRQPTGPPQQPGGGPQQQLPHTSQSAQPPAQTPAECEQQAMRPTQSAPEQRKQPLEMIKCKYTVPLKVPHSGRIRSQPVSMLTNYLEMSINPIKVHRYDATVSPDKPRKLVPKVFQACMKQHFPKHIVAFDQFKNFYSVQPLPNVTSTKRFESEVEITDNNNRRMKFFISFKETGIVDFNSLIMHMKTGGTSLNPPTEVIQCVDVILRQGTLESYVKAGRQFFRRPQNPVRLGDGLEMWTGLFQSAIFTSRSFINIDVAHKGFPINQPLMSMLSSLRLDPSRPVSTQRGRGLDTFTAFIKGLRVTAKLGGNQAIVRDYMVNRLVEPADVQTFIFTDEHGKDKKMTVAQYFNMKGCRLQYPKQNCVWVGPQSKSIYYPMEVLDVAYGQVRNRQLNESQLSTMVKEAATPPNIRKQKIEEVIRDMNYRSNTYFKHFGLAISDKFTPIQGRILDAPRIDYGHQQPVIPNKGAWMADRVLQGASLNTWGVIAVELSPASANAEALISMIRSTGIHMGMRVEAPEKPLFNVSVRELERIMFKATERKFQLLIVIFDARSKDTYSQVKKIAEKKVGLLTQCLKDVTVNRRLNPQTVRNILLKVNSKLMGINHAIDNSSIPACMARGNIMVVGADVTHPSPEQSSIPSIAAVTASIDKKCFKYNIEFSIQTPKKEVIVQFEDMMVDHLQVYRKEQGSLPAKIYVFRDGVSEGQFAQVMNSELQAVYNAYARLNGGTGKPEVMFLLVQKRHHTRFFMGDRPENVKPGTVVDSLIVHPTELDFYLVSHQAIKGTARPTRYHAVCNDGKLPADEVEQLVYYLCHLYCRCSRAVSYPTPTYYAHLACLRARALTLNEKYDNDALEKNPIRFKILPKVQEESRMFFV